MAARMQPIASAAAEFVAADEVQVIERGPDAEPEGVDASPVERQLRHYDISLRIVGCCSIASACRSRRRAVSVSVCWLAWSCRRTARNAS